MRRAAVSWPVVIQVRPQQAGSGITAARRPAISSSRTAARPVSAAKRSVNESAQIQTSTFSASGLPRERSGRAENWGRLRRWSTPAAALATWPTFLLRSIVLASFGGVILAQRGSWPSAMWERGRRRKPRGPAYFWERASDL